MKRFVFAVVLGLASVSFGTGCRSCQSCHDYDPPVANCQCAGCDTCGGGRAGSVLSRGYAGGEVIAQPEMYDGELMYADPMMPEGEVTE